MAETSALRPMDLYFDQSKATFVRWKVANNSRVMPGTLLFTYRVTGSASVKQFKAPDVHGLVAHCHPLIEGDSLLKGTYVLSVKICQHPVVMKDMCTYCGKDLRRREGRPGEREINSDANVAVVDSIPELHVTKDLARDLGLEERKRLLDAKKLVLLVDLDQTLIHTTTDDVNPKIKDVHHYQLNSLGSWYHTRLRPNTKHFLDSVAKLFQLRICTFGVRPYAHKVASILDPDKTLFSHRILSRDECFDPNLKTANLKALFPCGDQMVCIIDDREDVWNSAPNLIHVKPYRFFKHTGDINAPPGFLKTDENTEHQYQFQHPKTAAKTDEAAVELTNGTKAASEGEAHNDDEQIMLSEEPNKLAAAPIERRHSTLDNEFPNVTEEQTQEEIEDDDDYLCYLEEILQRVHKAFYQVYDKLQETEPGAIPDLKTVVPYVKRKILRDCSIVFSAVIPTKTDPKSTPIYRAALAFGAEIQENIVLPGSSAVAAGQRPTTHLVIGGWGTNKVKEALRRGSQIKIVTAQWLWCCIERWERVDERLFIVNKENAATFFPRQAEDAAQAELTQTGNKSPRGRDDEEASPVPECSSNASGSAISEKVAVNGIMAGPEDVAALSNDIPSSGDTSITSPSAASEPLLAESDTQTVPSTSAVCNGDLDRTNDDAVTLTACQRIVMTAEVNEVLSDEESSSEKDGSSENSDVQRLSSSGLSSDDDSLAGEVPLGWKRKVADLDLAQELEDGLASANKRRKGDDTIETIDLVDSSDEEKDSDDIEVVTIDDSPDDDDEDDGESIGSVDQEIVDALEQEVAHKP